MDILANAVRVTLGPKGRNVLLEKKYGLPVVTNDGVTIAQEIEVEESEKNVGVQVAKEIATKTNRRIFKAYFRIFKTTFP